MINRVTLSGVLDDTSIEVKQVSKTLCVAHAYLTTQNSSKTQSRKVKITLYNDLAKKFVYKQEDYKKSLCLYYGEVLFVEDKDTTMIKINSLPTIISKL